MYLPNSQCTRIVDAAVEPLALADAKNYLRVEISADDALISDLITAARLECEQIRDGSIINTTWQLTLDYLPFTAGPFIGFPLPLNFFNNGGGTYGRILTNDGGITLPYPPLVSVVSINYYAQDGTLQSLDITPGGDNLIVQPGTPGRIYPAFAKFFPLSQPRPQAVAIQYVAGYGPTPDTIPKNIIQAMRLLVAHYYTHRTSDVATPDCIYNLLTIGKNGGTYA